MALTISLTQQQVTTDAPHILEHFLGALQFVDGMTLFYCDPKEDVMIPKQSTTALPDRLTQGKPMETLL